MQKSKFEILREILACDKYAVDIYKGIIYHRYRGEWKELKPTTLPNGYQQVKLYAGRGLGIMGKFYVHQVVYFVGKGEWVGQILHRGDLSDNSLQNLVLRQIKPLVTRKQTKGLCKVVRGTDLKFIKSYIDRGYTTAQICSRLDLRPTTVKRTVKLIKANHVFKYATMPAPVQYLRDSPSKPDSILI